MDYALYVLIVLNFILSYLTGDWYGFYGMCLFLMVLELKALNSVVKEFVLLLVRVSKEFKSE